MEHVISHMRQGHIIVFKSERKRLYCWITKQH